MYYNYLYNRGDISKYLSENNQEDSGLKELIKDVLEKQIDEDIEDDNLDKAQKDLEIAIKNEPDNPNLNNSLAYLNYKKGDYDSALKNINFALEKEPDNKNLISNKIELIDKQNDLTDDSKNFLVNKLIDKEADKDIQNKALDVTLKNVEKGKVELNDETMEKLLDNKNNQEDNQEINLKNNINESKTAKLISANILNKSKKEGKEGQYTINKELKSKINENLTNPNMKNELLSSYKCISNLEEKDIEMPMKIITDNIEYESNSKAIDESVNVLSSIVKNNKNVEVNEKTFTNLTDFINTNDYNQYSQVDEIIDKKEENNKTFWEKFQDKVNENVKKELKEIVNEFEDDKDKQYELIKHIKEKGYNITKNKLTYSQGEKKKTISNMFDCLNSIGKSNKGFTKENLNEMSNLMKINNSQSKDFQKFKKKEIIKVINNSMEANKKQILTNDLMDEISKEINTKKKSKKSFASFKYCIK